MDEVRGLMTRPEFPRSARYDDDWMLSNQMGPNAVWLAEWLLEKMSTGRMVIEPDMRVLDLGCGKAMTSIFLAKEFSARVWAVDLWMEPDGNWRRAREAGVADLVCPVRAEAHALPFAAGFFDAVISIDAYQYFGTDELYLDYLARFVRPGGTLGIVAPALAAPMDVLSPPEHLVQPQSNGKVFWESACRSFKTLDFWRDLWRRCELVEDVAAELQPEGWRHWRDFERALEISGKSFFPSDAEAIDRDGGRFLGFVGMTARRSSAEGENAYDPALGLRVGAES